MLLQQAGHALKVVLDAVVYLAYEHLALRDRRVASFVQPAGVVVQRIDPQTGKLAAPGAPAIDEVFLEGTAPTEQAIAPGESDPSTFNME